MKNYIAEFSAKHTPSEVPKVPEGAFGTFGTLPGVRIENSEGGKESGKDLSLEVPKVPEATMASVLIREAAVRGWQVEFKSTKVPPLPKEIVAELLGRGFPRRVIDSMSHSEAADWLFRDGGSTWT